MKKRFGRMETMVLAYAQMRGLRIVRTGMFAEPLGLTRKQETDLLERLKRGRLVARLRRGAYLFPSSLPVAGEWAPDEAMALNALMEDAGARYQLCGPNAFNRYGLSDQIPNKLYVYNDRLSGERSVGAVGILLIKVAGKRLGDTENVKRSDGNALVYPSRVRTLVDSVYDWSRFGSLPRGFGWIRSEIAARRVTPAALVRCTLKYGDVGTIRRIGCVLERLGVSGSRLVSLHKALKPTRSTIALVPGRPKQGRVNRRWGVVENDQPGDIDDLSAS